MLNGTHDILNSKSKSNDFTGKYSQFSFNKHESQVQGELLVKAFDDGFWNDNNFDIFYDSGPVNTSSYLIVNATKIMKYFTPVAFVEMRYENGTTNKMGTYFQQCKDADLKSLPTTNQITNHLHGRLCPNWEANDLYKKV